MAKKINEIIIKTLSPFNPTRIGIFGSYARNEETKNSDLDIVFEHKKNINLLDLVEMEYTLSEKIGIKVDLLTKKSIHPLIMPYVKKDLQIIYESWVK